MEYLISANTDIGTTKKTNQDSLDMKILNTSQGRMVFAILCDGMGGLEKGEVASSAVIQEFDRWVKNELPVLCNGMIEDNLIRRQWENIIERMNHNISNYGARQGVKMGTTVAAILLTGTRYYILNVGDSRVYEIADSVRQLTTDQTFVGREVALGHMTEKEAQNDKRKNILLQCVGASDEVYPEMVYGDTKKDAVYMLCSDGFRHEISTEEIFQSFMPQELVNTDIMYQRTEMLIEENKKRGERDNITAALIRTY